MDTINVSLVLEKLELTDEHLGRIFDALPDAVPAAIGGIVTISSPVRAADTETAAFDLVDRVGKAVPDAVVVRVDQDLVAIPDIAERTGRSRESVRLLAEGKRGPGHFPSPVGIVGDGIRVWPWASILDWFSHVLGEDLGERAVPPEVAALVDACLASRRRQLAKHASLTWDLGAPQTRARHVDVASTSRFRPSSAALVS